MNHVGNFAFPLHARAKAGVVEPPAADSPDAAKDLVSLFGEMLRQPFIEQLADAVFSSKVKDPSRRARFPIPLPSSTKIGHDKNWTELAKAAEEASLRDGVIAPHSTAEGLLYFDLQGQFDLLNNARLYIPELVALEKNHGLLFFDIDLSRAASH